MRITRRDLLRDIGAAGATTLLAVGSARQQLTAEELAAEGQTGQPSSHPLPQPTLSKESSPLLSDLSRRPRPEDLVEVRAGEMVVAFDRRYGSICSITRKGDPLRTNFIGNESNTPGIDVSNSRWTGDLVTAVWEVTDTNPAHRNWCATFGFCAQGEVEAGTYREIRGHTPGGF